MKLSKGGMKPLPKKLGAKTRQRDSTKVSKLLEYYSNVNFTFPIQFISSVLSYLFLLAIGTVASRTSRLFIL